MSQTSERYELIRNDNNTFAVRGKGGGGGEVTVDTELDGTSTNPVENKAIYEGIHEVFEGNTYATGTLTDSDTLTQLRADIAEHKPIVVGGYTYYYVDETTADKIYRYVSFKTKTSIMKLTITDSTSSIEVAVEELPVTRKAVNGVFTNGQIVTNANTIDALNNGYDLNTITGRLLLYAKLTDSASYVGISTLNQVVSVTFELSASGWTPTVTLTQLQRDVKLESGYNSTTPQTLGHVNGTLTWKDEGYTYPTALTGDSGTITSATDLIRAIQNKIPITFTINGITATFIHVLTDSGESDYVCAYLDGNVVTHVMHLNPDTENNQVTWTSAILSVPSPLHSSDGGKVLKASTTTDGEYDLGALAIDVSNLYNSASHATESLYVNSNSAGQHIAYGKPASTFGLGVITTAPASANTDGIKIVVLSSEPATKYSGYLYIVTGS